MMCAEQLKKRSILIVNLRREYLKGLVDIIKQDLSGQELDITVMSPNYKFWTHGASNKIRIVILIITNFIYFLFSFAKFRKKYDVVLLNGVTIAIPYLIISKVVSRFRPKERLVLIHFYFYGLAKNKHIQSVLKFLLRCKNLLIIVFSRGEIGYYSEQIGMDLPNIAYYPYCQSDVTFSEECGRGQDYVFSGGYTNRDYDCLLDAALKVDHEFLIICSRRNKIRKDNLHNVQILMDMRPHEFYGFLKNANIVVIPLKEETAASGQMVALGAMFLKKPVIYANISSLSQYFDDGVTGLSYEPGNAEDLAGRIQQLLSSEYLRKELGQKAYETYCDNYQIKALYHYVAGLMA
jgi:glycosyltransferase involved in cell wall biosynthesis